MIERLQAREDRFVLEMLKKINKSKYEKEVQPLILHFHKLEKLKDEHQSGDTSQLKKELLAENSSGGGLLGLASSLIGTKKAVVRNQRQSTFASQEEGQRMARSTLGIRAPPPPPLKGGLLSISAIREGDEEDSSDDEPPTP